MTATDPEPTGPKLSDCCGVPVNTDILMCPLCLEHCGAVDAEEEEVTDEPKKGREPEYFVHDAYKGESYVVAHRSEPTVVAFGERYIPVHILTASELEEERREVFEAAREMFERITNSGIRIDSAYRWVTFEHYLSAKRGEGK